MTKTKISYTIITQNIQMNVVCGHQFETRVCGLSRRDPYECVYHVINVTVTVINVANSRHRILWNAHILLDKHIATIFIISLFDTKKYGLRTFVYDFNFPFDSRNLLFARQSILVRELLFSAVVRVILFAFHKIRIMATPRDSDPYFLRRKSRRTEESNDGNMNIYIIVRFGKKHKH